MAFSREDEISEEILKDHIHREYSKHNFKDQPWRMLPEIPTKIELMPKKEPKNTDGSSDPWNDYMFEPTYDEKLPKNIINGPWPSTLDYLATHYQLIREDGIADLRNSIRQFRMNPSMNESKETAIYTNVHIIGLVLGPTGAAFRVEFSHDRVGKRIRWEQSKRLQQGSIVALSPENSVFEKECKIAIVAARPVTGGLDQNPPQIDLFWGDINDTAIDPAESYVMIEARTGYFEAYRHTLVAMQKLAVERFSLAEHIVALEKNIQPPQYLLDHPYMNLNGLIHSDVDLEAGGAGVPDDRPLESVNVVEEFPEIPLSGMDKSQTQACKRMLTSKLAIVQGPPGTGKTFTSVSAIRALLDSMGPDDPPVIIAAQTNHALDQLMKHVMRFEEKVVRLGGRTAKENNAILERTLYQLRISNRDFTAGGRSLRQRRAELDAKIVQIQTEIQPLLSPSLLSDNVLFKYGIINKAQKDSLYEEGWNDPVDSIESNGIIAWLPVDQIRAVARTPPINLGLPLEEMDLEYEQLQGQEEEDGPQRGAENDVDAMKGTAIPFQRMRTGKSSSTCDDRKIQKELSKSTNLYKIMAANRGSFYRYFERMVDRKILVKLKELLEEYQTIVNNTRITKWLCNIKLMRHLGIKVIGCTTTGLSKYRGLIAGLQPRTLLVEEAAETLEANVIAGMVDSLEHLILVGDHQQLQAHANVSALEQAPFHLAISMFERLVNNSVGFTMLNEQRRMIPEVRKLLCIEPSPFYKNLHDHPSVLDRVENRPHVPGMGGRDVYFFHHNWPEATNSDFSRFNVDEAEMITEFFNYLVLNGTQASKITVLTFYNGQRKIILRELKRHPTLGGNTYFNVFTVDSYQGEENDIILLSLVRSNDHYSIGFLESKNRLVVALSRARCGLYIFGNTITLSHSEATEDRIGRDPLWNPILSYMRQKYQVDIDEGFPITCVKHGKTLYIKDADHFSNIAGGCDQKCHGLLACGHDCIYTCHAFDHDKVICSKACPKILPCGHGCSKFCGEFCDCSQCNAAPKFARFDKGAVDSCEHGDECKPNPRMSKIGHSSSDFEFSPRVNSIASSDIRRERCQDFGASPPNQFSAKTRPGHYIGGAGNRLSGKARFQSLKPDSTESNPISAKDWKNFDAKKADKHLAYKRRLKAEAAPKFDSGEQIIQEKYLKVTVKDGIRETGKASRRTLSGAQNGEDLKISASSASALAVAETVPQDASVSSSSIKAVSKSEALLDDQFGYPGDIAAKTKTERMSDDLIDLIGDEMRRSAKPMPTPKTFPEGCFGPKSSLEVLSKIKAFSEDLIDFEDETDLPAEPRLKEKVWLEDLLGSFCEGAHDDSDTLSATNMMGGGTSGYLGGIGADLCGLELGKTEYSEVTPPVTVTANIRKAMDDKKSKDELSRPC